MRRDRGTAAVEMALAFVVILMIAIGAYEFGTGFIDRNAMANAAREGARAGAAAGDYDNGGGDDADCVIIEAAAGALSGIAGNDVRELWIYESDDTGFVGLNGNIQRYRRPIGSDTVDLVCAGGDWSRQSDTFPPSERALGSRKWLGVKLVVDHSWKTNFLFWSGTTTWEEDVVMRIEPSAG
jgi:TadE-like protein